MWDTYQMWRMMRLLKRHQHDWAHTEHKAHDTETAEQANERVSKQFLEVAQRTTEPDILVVQMAVEYMKKYNGFPGKLTCDHDREPTKKLSAAKTIVFNCKEKEYIEYTSELNGKKEVNPYHAYITFKGKKFATIEGLLKEWFTDDVGPLWSVVVAVVTTVSLVRFEWVVKVTGLVSPWW